MHIMVGNGHIVIWLLNWEVKNFPFFLKFSKKFLSIYCNQLETNYGSI